MSNTSSALRCARRVRTGIDCGAVLWSLFCRAGASGVCCIGTSPGPAPRGISADVAWWLGPTRCCVTESCGPLEQRSSASGVYAVESSGAQSRASSNSLRLASDKEQSRVRSAGILVVRACWRKLCYIAALPHAAGMSRHQTLDFKPSMYKLRARFLTNCHSRDTF
jgi:hypothetical protein